MLFSLCFGYNVWIRCEYDLANETSANQNNGHWGIPAYSFTVNPVEGERRCFTRLSHFGEIVNYTRVKGVFGWKLAVDFTAENFSFESVCVVGGRRE